MAKLKTTRKNPKTKQWEVVTYNSMKNVQGKKRLALAVAAVLFRHIDAKNKTGKYSKTYRALTACITRDLSLRISENWMRLKLKRLGIGLSKKHYHEMYEAKDGWRVTRLSAVAYMTPEELYEARKGGGQEIVIFSHHHANGAAWEIKPLEPICVGCMKPIPPAVKGFEKLITLGKKVA